MENNLPIINQKISEIDISDIIDITLITNNYQNIKIKSPNFYKIVKLIVDNTKKTEFAENELSTVYEHIINNYQSQIDDETYTKIKELV
jgi:hypothetical protein